MKHIILDFFLRLNDVGLHRCLLRRFVYVFFADNEFAATFIGSLGGYNLQGEIGIGMVSTAHI